MEMGFVVGQGQEEQYWTLIGMVTSEKFLTKRGREARGIGTTPAAFSLTFAPTSAGITYFSYKVEMTCSVNTYKRLGIRVSHLIFFLQKLDIRY